MFNVRKGRITGSLKTPHRPPFTLLLYLTVNCISQSTEKLKIQQKNIIITNVHFKLNLGMRKCSRPMPTLNFIIFIIYKFDFFFNKPCSCPCFTRLHSPQYNNIFTMLRACVPTGARDELDEGLSTL